MSEETNKAALRRFYEKKDPHRVKNVEPLFLRYDQDDILYFVEHKYGETPEGWVQGDGGSGYDLPASPLASPENRKSQGGGLLGAAKGLFGSQKNIRKSQGKSSLSIDPARKSVDRPRDSHDSEDSGDTSGVRPQSNSFLPPASPMTMHATKSMAELKVDGDNTQHLSEPRVSSPSPSPPPSTIQQVDIPDSETKAEVPATSNTLSSDEVAARLEEAKAREREALEEARAEERRIQEKLARGREAIERAKRELEEKEIELDAMRKKLAEEARQEAKQQIAQGKPVTTDGPSSAAVEELKKAQAEVELKQIETIGKLEEAEKERIILEEKKQLVKIEEAERQAKIQLIETFEAPAVEAKADEDEEKQQGDEAGDVIGELPAHTGEEASLMDAAPKRMTLYERKLQAALEAPAAAAASEEEPAPVSSSGRKTLLGGMMSRLTISSRRKTISQPPPAQAAEPIVEEAPAAVVVEEAPAAPVAAVAQPAISIPTPAFAAPTSIVTDLSADELEKWKLRALEAESRTKVLQMEAEERARKFQMEAEERIRKLEAMAAAAFRPQAEAAAAPSPAAPAIPAAAASSAASAGSDLNGYKLLPRDHPDLNKFHKMAKAGLPQGAVENAMIREGFHPKSVFDNPMNDPKAPGNPAAAPAPAAAAPAAAASGGGDGDFKRPPQDSPDLEKYKKMQKAGLPQGAIENAMMRDMIHPAALFGASAINDPKPPKKVVAAPAPAAAAGGASKDEYKKLPQDSPDLEKYKKMQKAGLPQGAIENAMMRDMVHPASIFGANAINDPKPPKSVAGGAKPAAAAGKPAAAAAAPAAPVDPSKPPPGMSMMEEMKWKQAQKAKMPQKAFVEPAKKPDDKPAAAAAPLAPGPNDKPPPGLSMMEEMKWKQAQKAALAAAGGGPAPIKEPPKKEAPAPAQAPKVVLKSTPNAAAATKAPATTAPASKAATAPGAIPKPATPAAPAWSKPPAKAVVQAAANLAAAPPPPNVDALVNLLVGAKISADNAKKYATALAKEGFDSPDKLALLDEGDLTACGITARFDIKTILALKNNLPKPAAAPPPAAAAAATKPGAAPAAATKPGAVPAAKPGAPVPAASAGTKPGVAAPAAAAKPGVAAAPAAAGAKPGVAAAPAKPAVGGAAAAAPAKPAVGAAANKPSVPAAASGGGFQKPALKNSAEAQAQKDAERLAFVMALGAPTSAYKKPKQIG